MSGLSVTSVLPDEVTVELSGGPARVHAVWLRDNARDDASRHAGNDQRLFDVTELPDHVVVRAAEVVARADQFLLTIFAIEILLRVGTFRPPALDVFKRPPLGHLHAHLVGRLKILTRPQLLIDLLAVLVRDAHGRRLTELARVEGLDPATGDYRLAPFTTPKPGDLQ